MAYGNLHKFGFLHILFTIILLLAACSQVEEGNQPDVIVTMTDTVGVQPTLVLPPTVTEGGFPTYTWSSTSTSIDPSPTPTLESSATPTEFYPTYTPLPFIAAWKYSTIRFVNDSGKTVRFTLYGDEVIDLTIGKTLIVKVRFDTYYFTALIGKNGPYNGSIFINNMDRYTIFIDEDNIRVAYP